MDKVGFDAPRLTPAQGFNHNFLAICYATLFMVGASSAFAATAVMPLGDSVTGGYTGNPGNGGYRAPLWSSLIQEGYAVDFVGSQTGPAPPGVDPDHEGHGGWRADDLAGSIDGWIAAYRPDVILLLAGANDLIQGYGVSATLDHLDGLLAEIFYDRPSAVVLLGSLWWVPTPNPYNYNVSQIQAVNVQLPGLVAKYAQQGRVIESVDLFNLGWSTGDFGADVIHPVASGYAKMAQAWHDPLASHLAGTSPLSPDGSIISGGTGSLTAPSGVWTFGTPSSARGNWSILRNGAADNGAVGQKLEVSNGGQLYVFGVDNAWYLWAGSAWVPGDPGGSLTISPDGSIIRGGTGSLVTASGMWTFGTDRSGGNWDILLNGSAANGAVGSQLEVYRGDIWLLGLEGAWWRWTGVAWAQG